MRFSKIFNFMFLLIFSVSILKTYGQAIQMLSLNPSPRLNGLGMTGTSLPNDDPFGFYYNPAQLGHFSQTNNLAYQFYPSNVDWLGLNLFTYRNSAFNIGYNFQNELKGLSLSAGFGYIHSKLDYGNIENVIRNDINPLKVSNSYDEFSAYSLGIGIDYYVQLNIGITNKNVYSHPGVNDQVNGNMIYANPTAIDYGILLTAPVVKLISPGFVFNMMQNNLPVPYFNISIGYARLNQGGEVYYIDLPRGPLPRTARLGYTLSTGIYWKMNKNLMRIISYDFTVDAVEYLITSPSDLSGFSYKNGIGDISIGRNLIQLKSSQNVVVQKGHEFNLFETFTVMIGRFDGNGYYNDESNGIGLRLKGILNLLNEYMIGKSFNFIANHFDIQFYSSKVEFGTGLESKFASINLVFYNFEF